MSQIIKAFMGVFFILFMSVTAVGILTAYMEVMNAQDMQARIVDEIENSDFSSPVIRSCFEQAGKAVYRLDVTLFYEGGGTAGCGSISTVPYSISAVDMARVELTFPFRVSFLGINKEHTFSSYAR